MGNQQGLLEFPKFGENFPKGKLEMALGARSWSTLYFEYKLKLDIYKHLYSSVENETMLGNREKKPE